MFMHDTQNMPLTPLCLKVEWGLAKTKDKQTLLIILLLNQIVLCVYIHKLTSYASGGCLLSRC